MKNAIDELIKYFKKIKNVPFNKSLRKGPTGIGYTFETLIDKKEDSSHMPDFKGIEVKTKIGYSKAPLTLFTLAPKKKNESAIKYILNTFGYPDHTDNNLKALRGDTYCQQNNLIANKYIFKSIVDYQSQKIRIIILDINYNVIEKEIYWDFVALEQRLLDKLSYLAYINGYPYKIKNEIYYKYTSLEIYKLKGFKEFLRLVETDEIHITFNIGCVRQGEYYGKIQDRGTAFRIKKSAINKLFDRIY